MQCQAVAEKSLGLFCHLSYLSEYKYKFNFKLINLLVAALLLAKCNDAQEQITYNKCKLH